MHNERFRILIVDDDAMVLRAWTRLLGRRFEIVTAEGATAAMAIATGEDAAFDAIFADVTMPGMDGIQLFDALRHARPDLEPRVVFLTGGTITERTTSFLRDERRPHLLKPASAGEIEQAVRRVVNACGRAAAAQEMAA